MSKRRSREIRSYGPGKFYTVIDSYAYGLVMDGFADSIYIGDETYDVVGGGPDLLKFVEEDAAESNDALSSDEVKFLRDSAGVIFFERSDGIVEAEWYASKKVLDRDIARLEKQAEESSGGDD